MSRYARKNGDSLVFDAWLALSSTGDMKLTRTEPRLAPQWRAMRINVTIPLAVFRTPTLSAEITIPESAGNPKAIPANVLEVAEDVIKHAIGCDVTLRLVPPPAAAPEGE